MDSANISLDTIDYSLISLVKVLNAMDTTSAVGEKRERNQVNTETIKGKSKCFLCFGLQVYDSYNTAMKDIDDAILKTKRENIPLILFGHSMVIYFLVQSMISSIFIHIGIGRWTYSQLPRKKRYL